LPYKLNKFNQKFSIIEGAGLPAVFEPKRRPGSKQVYPGYKYFAGGAAINYF